MSEHNKYIYKLDKLKTKNKKLKNRKKTKKQNKTKNKKKTRKCTKQLLQKHSLGGTQSCVI